MSPLRTGFESSLAHAPARSRTASVAIIGAGPQALTLAALLVALEPKVLEDLVVLDPSGGWLVQWHERFRRLQIPHLRSPVVHHPDPAPYALEKFAHDTGKAGSLFGKYQLPSTAIFQDFCAHLIERCGLEAAVLPVTVEAVQGNGVIHCSDGSQIEAGHVVLAHAASAPVIPQWVDHKQLDHNPVLGLGLETSSGNVPVRLAEDIDLEMITDRAQGKKCPVPHHIAVVGGGLSAAHLAVGAARRGLKVVMCPRRPLRTSAFDTDPGWLGPKEMAGFTAVGSQRERARLAERARDGGSIPPWMMTEIESLGIQLEVGGEPRNGDLGAKEIWLATGRKIQLSEDVLLGPLLNATGVEVIDDRYVVLSSGLRIGESSVHLMGRSATLSLGPTAGNLSGARHGAREIARSILGSEGVDRLDAAHGVF
jgi:hypothetical protein